MIRAQKEISVIEGDTVFYNLFIIYYKRITYSSVFHDGS